MTVASGIIALWIASLLLMAVGGMLVGAAKLDIAAERAEREKRTEKHKDVSPTKDVVMCRECRYLTFSAACPECARGYLGSIRPGDYCSRGERDDTDDAMH